MDPSTTVLKTKSLAVRGGYGRRVMFVVAARAGRLTQQVHTDLAGWSATIFGKPTTSG
jgi:hypothetical protein